MGKAFRDAKRSHASSATLPARPAEQAAAKTPGRSRWTALRPLVKVKIQNPRIDPGLLGCRDASYPWRKAFDERFGTFR